MANSVFSLGSITFTAATQIAADAMRDAALLDFCKLYNLPVYQADGVTPDQSKVVTQIRVQVAAILREQVKSYRARQAAAAAAATANAAPDDF